MNQEEILADGHGSHRVHDREARKWQSSMNIPSVAAVVEKVSWEKEKLAAPKELIIITSLTFPLIRKSKWRKLAEMNRGSDEAAQIHGILITH